MLTLISTTSQRALLALLTLTQWAVQLDLDIPFAHDAVALVVSMHKPANACKKQAGSRLLFDCFGAYSRPGPPYMMEIMSEKLAS